MNNVRLRNPYEIPLYIFSVLVNLLIIAIILSRVLFLGFVNTRSRWFYRWSTGLSPTPRGRFGLRPPALCSPWSRGRWHRWDSRSTWATSRIAALPTAASGQL